MTYAERQINIKDESGNLKITFRVITGLRNWKSLSEIPRNVQTSLNFSSHGLSR